MRNIRLYQLLMDDVEQFLVKPEFFLPQQVYLCKEQTFDEKIIAHRDGVGEIHGFAPILSVVCTALP